MTLRKFNSAKPGDPPSKDRVALYKPSPEEIHDRSEVIVKEYTERVKEGKKEQEAEKEKQND
jgi:hypothetical protein